MYCDETTRANMLLSCFIRCANMGVLLAGAAGFSAPFVSATPLSCGGAAIGAVSLASSKLVRVVPACRVRGVGRIWRDAMTAHPGSTAHPEPGEVGFWRPTPPRQPTYLLVQSSPAPPATLLIGKCGTCFAPPCCSSRADGIERAVRGECRYSTRCQSLGDCNCLLCRYRAHRRV
jgi:hypothetical protein